MNGRRKGIEREVCVREGGGERERESLQLACEIIVSSPDPTLCEQKVLVTLERFLGCADSAVT